VARKPDLEKRKTIAASAYAVMRERGVHNTSMSDIAKALGMKRPTLYWYFKDMEAIFEAVFEHILEDQARFVVGRVRDVSHPIDVMFEHMKAVHAYYDGQEDIILFLFQLWGVSASDEPGRAVDIMAKYFKPRRKAAKALLRQGIAKGLVAPCDPDAIVETMAALIDGVMVHKVANDMAIEPLYDTIWNHFLNPLKLSPPEPSGDDA